jgi:hypothetical protein
MELQKTHEVFDPHLCRSEGTRPTRSRRSASGDHGPSDR